MGGTILDYGLSIVESFIIEEGDTCIFFCRVYICYTCGNYNLERAKARVSVCSIDMQRGEEFVV